MRPLSAPHRPTPWRFSRARQGLWRRLCLVFAGLVAGAAVVGSVVVALPDLAGRSAVEKLSLLLGLFIAVRLWSQVVEPAISYLVGWRRRRIEAAFKEFESSALGARSTEDVALLLTQAFKEAFDARLVRLIPSARDRARDHASIAAAERVLIERQAPLLRDQLDGDPRGAELRVAFDRLGADVLIPLARDERLEAIAAVTADPLRQADGALTDELHRIGQRAALFWANAALYNEVAARAAGLEREVRLKTGELEGALSELKGAQARLVESERSSSLGLLVAGVSHEINNALNIIHANLPTLQRYLERYTALLAEGTGLAQRSARRLHPAILALTEATRRTRAIVDDLRKFARPDTERRWVRVEEGVEAALNLLRRRTDGRLDIGRVSIGSPTVDGYPGQLNQCFFNLLLNAVEAAHSEIWVTLSPQADEGGVELVIRDDGDGFSVDQESVLQPFFTTKPRSAGLGLTVAQAVVARHGGTLEIESASGRGACVRLRLPATAPPAAAP